MKYEVKKPFWHCNRPVAVGEVLDLDPTGARWLVGQGKVVQVSDDTGQESEGVSQNRRRGRKGAAAEETNVPDAPATTGGDGK
jgi:hypothetical protein